LCRKNDENNGEKCNSQLKNFTVPRYPLP
jgi:hypothetical protein